PAMPAPTTTTSCTASAACASNQAAVASPMGAQTGMVRAVDMRGSCAAGASAPSGSRREPAVVRRRRATGPSLHGAAAFLAAAGQVVVDRAHADPQRAGGGGLVVAVMGQGCVHRATFQVEI